MQLTTCLGRRHFLREQAWRGKQSHSSGKEQPSLKTFQSDTVRDIHRFKIDEVERTIICTTGEGGLFVVSIDTNETLWNLPEVFRSHFVRNELRFSFIFYVFSGTSQASPTWNMIKGSSYSPASRMEWTCGEDQLTRSIPKRICPANPILLKSQLLRPRFPNFRPPFPLYTAHIQLLQPQPKPFLLLAEAYIFPFLCSCHLQKRGATASCTLISSSRPGPVGRRLYGTLGPQRLLKPLISQLRHNAAEGFISRFI